MGTVRSRARVLLLLALVIGLRPLAAVAQERIAVFPEPGTPVIAAEVLVAAGLADEPEGRAGLANLTARALTRPIRPLLDSLEARLVIEPHKDAIAFTLIAAPDAWEEAAALLLVALFRDPVEAAAFEAERRAVHAQLLARQLNPADAVTREADLAHFGEDHPWSRPAVGRPETVQAITLTEVDAFLRDHFTAQRTLAAVVGPVDREGARDHLLDYLLPGGRLTRPALPARPPAGVVRTEYNSITTWITATYPIPAGADIETLRLLAHLVEEELAFGPTRRSVYDVRTSVIPRFDGGEMRFTLAIPPEEADAWAEHIREVVARVPEQPGLEESWEMWVRRYRGRRLIGLAAPENRAREAARRLFVTGSAGELTPEFGELSHARLAAAVAALGEPSLTLLGPFLDN